MSKITPEDEYSSEFLAKRWDNTRKIMEDAKGTELHPRRQLEHEVAGLHYQNALQRECREKDRQHISALSEQVGELHRLVEGWLFFNEMLPQRLTILEGAYTSLSMQAAQGFPVKKMIEAYEMGQKRQADRETLPPPVTPKQSGLTAGPKTE